MNLCLIGINSWIEGPWIFLMLIATFFPPTANMEYTDMMGTLKLILLVMLVHKILEIENVG